MARFRQVRTNDGDIVDMIALRFMGRMSGATEALYALNPGLARLGPTLPAGVILHVPIRPERRRAALSTVQTLWGRGQQ